MADTYGTISCSVMSLCLAETRELEFLPNHQQRWAVNHYVPAPFSLNQINNWQEQEDKHQSEVRPLLPLVTSNILLIHPHFFTSGENEHMRTSNKSETNFSWGWADYLHCSHQREVEKLCSVLDFVNQVKLLAGRWWSPGSDGGVRTFSTSERVAFSLRPSRTLELQVFLYRTYVCRFRSSAERPRGKTTTTWASRDAFAPGWRSEERNEHPALTSFKRDWWVFWRCQLIVPPVWFLHNHVAPLSLIRNTFMCNLVFFV